MSHPADPFAPDPQSDDAEGIESPGQPSESEDPSAEVEAERIDHGEAERAGPVIELSEGSAKERSDSNTLAMLAHLGPLALLLFGISMPLGFLVPLILLHTVGDGDPLIERHAKESVNFQLNMALLSIVFTISCIFIPLLLPLWLANIVFCILASVETSSGKDYRYPWIYRVVE